MEKLQELFDKGIHVNVYWNYFDQEDKEEVEESLQDITMPIHFVQIKGRDAWLLLNFKHKESLLIQPKS